MGWDTADKYVYQEVGDYFSGTLGDPLGGEWIGIDGTQTPRDVQILQENAWVPGTVVIKPYMYYNVAFTIPDYCRAAIGARLFKVGTGVTASKSGVVLFQPQHGTALKKVWVAAYISKNDFNQFFTVMDYLGGTQNVVVTLSYDTWYRVGIERNGSTLKCYFGPTADDNSLLEEKKAYTLPYDSIDFDIPLPTLPLYAGFLATPGSNDTNHYAGLDDFQAVSYGEAPISAIKYGPYYEYEIPEFPILFLPEMNEDTLDKANLTLRQIWENLNAIEGIQGNFHQGRSSLGPTHWRYVDGDGEQIHGIGEV